MNVARRERIPNFSFETAVSEGGQTERVSDDSTVVQAPIQTPFSTQHIRSWSEEKLGKYSVTERQKKMAPHDSSRGASDSVKRGAGL